MKFKLIFDFKKCKGCAECLKACAEAHQGFPNLKLFKVGEYSAIFRCMHCPSPKCESVCPVGALRRAPEGVVCFFPEKCIGCLNCLEACPFGAIFKREDTGTVAKCDMCYERIKQEGEPACVEACPEGALTFQVLKEKPKAKTEQNKPQSKSTEKIKSTCRA